MQGSGSQNNPKIKYQTLIFSAYLGHVLAIIIAYFLMAILFSCFFIKLKTYNFFQPTNLKVDWFWGGILTLVVIICLSYGLKYICLELTNIKNKSDLKILKIEENEDFRRAKKEKNLIENFVSVKPKYKNKTDIL